MTYLGHMLLSCKNYGSNKKEYFKSCSNFFCRNNQFCLYFQKIYGIYGLSTLLV